MDASRAAAGSQLLRRPTVRRPRIALSTFVRQRPKAAATLSLWLLGLFVAFLAPAPVAITREAAARYELSLRKAASQAPDLAAAERAVASASYAVSAEASWFWRFQGPEKREAVAKARARERAARARLEDLYLRGDEAVREGKAALGLWSQAGVDESRKTFRRAFENGKIFARRQTLWDGIMRALFGREERHPVVVIVELIVTAVVNFASGAVMSVFVFAAALPSLIRSYRPGFLSGLLFFFVAVLGAVSAAAAFVGALAAAGAGAAYGVVSIAARPAIAAAERERREALNPPRAPPRPRAPLDPRRNFND